MRTRLIYTTILGFVVVAVTACGTIYYQWKEAKFAFGAETSEAELAVYDDVNKVIEQARRRYDTLGYQRESEYITHLERIDAMLAGRPWTPPPRPAFGKGKASGGGAPKGADASKGGGMPKGQGKGMFGGGPPAQLLPALNDDERKAHFREIIKRWEERTKKSLRTELDAVKGRNLAPGELKQRFGVLMDMEADVVRESRDRYISKEIKPVLDKYRAQHANLVQRLENNLVKSAAVPKEAM